MGKRRSAARQGVKNRGRAEPPANTATRHQGKIGAAKERRLWTPPSMRLPCPSPIIHHDLHVNKRQPFPFWGDPFLDFIRHKSQSRVQYQRRSILIEYRNTHLFQSMNLSSPLQHIKDKISSDAFSPMPLCHDDIPYIGGLARQIVVEIGKRYDPSLFDNHRQIRPLFRELHHLLHGKRKSATRPDPEQLIFIFHQATDF